MNINIKFKEVTQLIIMSDNYDKTKYGYKDFIFQEINSKYWHWHKQYQEFYEISI